MGVMLVRVFNRRCTTGSVTVWNDEWPIAKAMKDWLVDGVWFEILGYYPDANNWGSIATSFVEAEEKANDYVNRR
jgi:hypothetical protein